MHSSSSSRSGVSRITVPIDLCDDSLGGVFIAELFGVGTRTFDDLVDIFSTSAAVYFGFVGVLGKDMVSVPDSGVNSRLSAGGF